MVEVQTQIVVHSSGPFGQMLAQMLEDEGVAVDRNPDVTYLGSIHAADDFVVAMMAFGTAKVIDCVIARFNDRTAGRARVDVDLKPQEAEPDDAAGSSAFPEVAG